VTISSATDSTVSRAAAHLLGALEHANARARADEDELLSPWAIAAMTISLAAAGLRVHLDGPVLPAWHPDCLTALRASRAELAYVRVDVDLPLIALADVLVHVSDATEHVACLSDPTTTAAAT
jgi:hypothetical protein